MTLCGLMPFNADFNKPDIGSVEQMRRLTDVAIVLDDKSTVPFLKTQGDVEGYTNKLEVLRSDHCLDHWNDYVNRLTLLARSCAYDAHWVLWMDDDDLIEDRVTKNYLKQQVRHAESEGFAAIQYRCREMWNEPGQYRCDGIYGQKRKIVLQKNPFLRRRVKWKYGPRHILHRWPLTDTPIKSVETQLLHFGMFTASQRRERYFRYVSIDPNNRFHKGGYKHIIDEEGIRYDLIKSSVE